LAPAPVLSVQPQTQQPQTPTDNAATHTLPGTNDQPLPPAYKLANKPEAAPVEKTQPPKAEPNTSHNLRTVVQPPLQSTDPNAHAIPGSKGQPQLPEANAPAVKDQSQIAKTPARTATPDAKPKGGVAASKLDAHSLPTKPAAPAIIDRTPAKPSIPNNSEPQLGGQRQDVPPSSGGVAPRPSLPREPHVAAPAQAPVPKPPAEPKLKVEPKIQAEPKPQAEPEPQPKPAIVEQQAKRPPATEKKKCGAPDQPACP
jgi:hypothetical protein